MRKPAHYTPAMARAELDDGVWPVVVALRLGCSVATHQRPRTPNLYPNERGLVMSDKIEDAVMVADEFIMSLCEPKLMTQAEALDYLGDVIERCRSAMEALREEMS